MLLTKCQVSLRCPIAGDPLNGKMDSVNYITATGVHLKKDAYTYDVKETNSVAGIKLFTDASLQQNAPPGLGYYAQYYNSVSNWVVPISETETLYDGSTAMTTTKQTFYDNIQHRQPTKTITVNSDSKIIQQEFNYPHEMVAKGVNPGNVYSDMINANMVAPVVETINSVDNAQQDKRIANYANIGFGTIIDKVSEDYQYRGGAIDPQASYEYTAAGNIKTVFRPNGSKTTYLWGYNQQYPIAQLVNASYQDVVAVLGQANIDLLAGSNPGTDAAVRTILDVLRTDVRLKAAQVTTFTYSPGAGVTSATDPRGNTIYYEYDDFQRLMNLKDQNGKIVKSYDYHYHQP
jgi:YD repeat-containing protein